MSAPPSSPLATPTRGRGNPHSAALLKALSAIQTGGKCKKTTVENAMTPYIQAARWFPLAIDPFVDLRTVVFEGMKADFRDQEGNELPDETDKQREQRGRYIKLYGEFKALIPGFNNIIFSFEGKPDLLQQFADTLADHASSARSEDIHSLRVRGIYYIRPNGDRDTFDPPFSVYGTKAVRGFHHPQTAEMLCPQHDLQAEFLEDPEAYMDAVNDGTIHIKSYQLPSFLYDQVEEFDPERRHLGLLCGDVVVRVYRHIFTGPSTAMTGRSKTSTKGCKAKLHHLTTITPNTIAYAATMARFMMCSVDNWTKRDGKFDLEAFYHYIVQLLDRRASPIGERWVTDTLAWWQMQVPGVGNNNVDDDDEYDEDDERNDIEAMIRSAARQGEDDNNNDGPQRQHLPRPRPHPRPRPRPRILVPQHHKGEGGEGGKGDEGGAQHEHAPHDPAPPINAPRRSASPSGNQLKDITRQDQANHNTHRGRNLTNEDDLYDDPELTPPPTPPLQAKPKAKKRQKTSRK